MIWFVVFMLVAVAIGLIVWQFRDSSSPLPPPDPEYLQRASIEMYRIRRRREGAELRHHQRTEAVRVKREIAEALEDDR